MNTTALPQGWCLTALADCCDIVSGSTPRRDTPAYWGGDIPWVTPKDLTALEEPYLRDVPETITQEGYDSCSTQMVPEGTVLFSSRAPIGLIAIAALPLCTNQGFKNLVPKSGVDSLYLYYCMKWITPVVQSMGRGATFAEVSKTVIGSVEVPLPPLSEQQRLARVLSTADGIRGKRRQAMRTADQLTPALFSHLFGGLNGKTGSWPVASLGDCCCAVKTIDPTKAPAEEFTYIDIASINTTEGQVESPQTLLGEDAPSRARQKVHTGDVLVSTVRPNLRQTAMVPKEHDGQVCSTGFAVLRAAPDKLDPLYLYTITRDPWFTNTLVSLTSGANYPAVRHKDVLSVRIPVPPIALQREFAKKAKAVHQLQDRMREAAKESDNLFHSLVQRAFKGEL